MMLSNFWKLNIKTITKSIICKFDDFFLMVVVLPKIIVYMEMVECGVCYSECIQF